MVQWFQVNVIACRDCGSMIESNSRGCQTCALNLEAERMIDHVVAAVVAVILLAVIAVVIVVYLRH